MVASASSKSTSGGGSHAVSRPSARPTTTPCWVAQGTSTLTAYDPRSECPRAASSASSAARSSGVPASTSTMSGSIPRAISKPPRLASTASNRGP